MPWTRPNINFWELSGSSQTPQSHLFEGVLGCLQEGRSSINITTVPVVPQYPSAKKIVLLHPYLLAFPIFLLAFLTSLQALVMSMRHWCTVRSSPRRLNRLSQNWRAKAICEDVLHCLQLSGCAVPRCAKWSAVKHLFLIASHRRPCIWKAPMIALL